MSQSNSETGDSLWVFSFGSGKAQATEDQKELLGGKGANLQGMTRLGLPVPPGFTLSTEVCRYFYAYQKYPQELQAEVLEGLKQVEASTGRTFGGSNPLLVSVRSGARASMPGMMDTVLNLGLNDLTVEGLIRQSSDARFSYDSYRRFIAMYADVVLGIHASVFESLLEEMKASKGVVSDAELGALDLKGLIEQFKQTIRAHGAVFPEDPLKQLWGAIGAVLGSWMSPRAVVYRQLHKIPEEWGTAVTVQAMVFGNQGNDCATGVAFTRDPSTGERTFFGEFLINAQGEDVVAGVRTPQKIDASEGGLQQLLPAAYAQLWDIQQVLEKHYRDMQDIEFTIEKGKLYILQTRHGKRTAASALKIAVDMVEEGLITEHEALLRVEPRQLDQLLHPRLDPSASKTVIATGLPASPGAVSGQVVFDSETAEKWVKQWKRSVILVRLETSPEDIHGMSLARGILTARGGMTSHAAVVARGMGLACVSGCSQMKVQLKEFHTDAHVIREGDWITLDGSTGEVILGKLPTLMPTLGEDFRKFMSWVDQTRSLEVRVNADTGLDARVARSFGAQGVGLCRTEHMFFDVNRIDAVREMIVAETSQARHLALEKILPMQKSDFQAIFQEMEGFPVTIRLLDPPLHEFIPHQLSEIELLASKLGIAVEQLQKKIQKLHEFNPMLGHRGCRLGVSYPEIYRTQVRAIFEAACELSQQGFKVQPEIMIPLVGDWRELKFIRDYCVEEADAVFKKYGHSMDYRIGTMIELPRAALTASEIAQYADFFSFGTNDLTQTTWGLSRDDSGSFLNAYLEAGIYEDDPFATLDRVGVGRLMKLAIEEGRLKKPHLKIGLCGEHGGEPSSVEYCHELHLDYVSCSPYRIPIAKLAASQAYLRAQIQCKG